MTLDWRVSVQPAWLHPAGAPPNPRVAAWAHALRGRVGVLVGPQRVPLLTDAMRTLCGLKAGGSGHLLVHVAAGRVGRGPRASLERSSLRFEGGKVSRVRQVLLVETGEAHELLRLLAEPVRIFARRQLVLRQSLLPPLPLLLLLLLLLHCRRSGWRWRRLRRFSSAKEGGQQAVW